MRCSPPPAERKVGYFRTLAAGLAQRLPALQAVLRVPHMEALETPAKIRRRPQAGTLERPDGPPILHGYHDGWRPLPAGRTGKQPLPKIPAEIGGLSPGCGALLPLPAHHCYPFALYAVAQGGAHLRPRRHARPRKAVDSAGKRAAVLRIFQEE